MSLKKLLSLTLTTALVAALFVGCSPAAPVEEAPAPEEVVVEEVVVEEEAMYKDGVYFAKEDGFSEETGWKYYVTIEVKDGKIDNATWNGVHKDAGMDKKTLSTEGLYGMVEKAGAQSEWHEQAALVEAYLIEKQNPEDITYQEDNYHSDAISGATIGVSPFFGLAKQALAGEVATSGTYTDGFYHAEEADFSEETGWKYMVDVTVVNGYIEAVSWNGMHKDGGDDKITQSTNGEYGMVENGGAQSAWFTQAEIVEAYLINTQDPSAITYQEDNYHTDAISGATIGVSPFFTLASEALGL